MNTGKQPFNHFTDLNSVAERRNAPKSYSFRCNLVNLTFYVLISLVFHTANVLAQQFSVTPSSVNVSTDENFQITYSLLNVGMVDFQAPSLDDFYIVGGPNKSQSVQFVNGRTSSSVSIGFVLRAKRAGTFTIPPALITTDKRQTLRSEKVTVSVSSGRNPQSKATPNPRAQHQPTSPPSGSNNATAGNPNVWISVFPDTTKAYIGQQVTVIYRLYTNVDIGNYAVKSPPSFTGFWVEDITPTFQQTPGNTTIKGEDFRFVDIKKYALFPQRSGPLEIDPMNVQVIARIPNQQAGGGFWGGFFYSNQEVNITTDPLKLEIADLPQNGKPDNFTGAVGQYEIGTVVGNPNVETNGSVQLKIMITGSGNTKMIDLPKPNFPASIETFDPMLDEENFVQQDRVKGRKIYEYTLIPSEAGQQQLPAIEFSFFNPETRTYQTASSPPIILNVKQGKETAKPVATKALPKTLAPLNSGLSLYRQGYHLFGSPLYYALVTLPFLMFAVATVLITKRKEEQLDPEELRQKMAQKVAIQRLATAQTHKLQNNRRAFYDEVIRTIWNYLSDRVHIPASQLDKNNIATILQQNNVSSDNINRLLQTIGYCEIALFAPSANAIDMEGTYQNAINAIAQVEEDLKNTSENVQE